MRMRLSWGLARPRFRQEHANLAAYGSPFSYGVRNPQYLEYLVLWPGEGKWVSS